MSREKGPIQEEGRGGRKRGVDRFLGLCCGLEILPMEMVHLCGWSSLVRRRLGKLLLGLELDLGTWVALLDLIAGKWCLYWKGTATGSRPHINE